MKWPWSREKGGESLPKNQLVSIGDPAAAGYFTVGGLNYSGAPVNEASALGTSALWRAYNLIASTLASLPLRTLSEPTPGTRKRTTSVFDDPGGIDGQTPFAWKETLFLHLLLHGNAFALKVRNVAGAVVGLPLVHPMSVVMELPSQRQVREGKLPQGGLWYIVTLDDGSRRTFDAYDIMHVPGLSMDGKRGMSILSIARNSLGTTIAGDRAAAKMFNSGALISGLVSPEEDCEPEETDKIRDELNRNITGWENAGAIAVVNRRLTFTPWTMTAVDAQFLQSRQFQIEEIARWTGVPPFELMQTEKQTSWGTGIEAQQRGLGRTVLAPWATRVQEACSRLLSTNRFIEFDFAGLERPTPAEEIDLLLKQVEGGLLTLNEARAVRNMPPVPGGDTVMLPSGNSKGVEENVPATQ